MKIRVIRGFNHICEVSQVRSIRAGPRQLFARDANAVTILNRNDHAEQNQRRKRNDGVERLVRRAVTHRQRSFLIRRGAHDQLTQVVDCLRRGYGLTLPVIWTSAGPFSILTGAGDTGSASGKKRSSL